MTTRWIRARILVKVDRHHSKIFTDVGPDELKKLKVKYPNLTVEDWGRYDEPRTEADAEDKKYMREILRK